MLLQEIDREVQDVNIKTQFKSLGRQARISQHPNHEVVQEEIITKRGSRSVKQTKGSKLQSLQMVSQPKLQRQISKEQEENLVHFKEPLAL